MNEEDKILFKRLKDEVSNTFLQENKVENPNYALWKGQEITRFQDDFLKKAKSSFSEKWFYTYFKQEPEKLPRIDMLNILAQYAGYQSWADFKYIPPVSTINKQGNLEEEKEFVDEIENPIKNNFNKKYWVGGIVSVLTVIASYFGFVYKPTNEIQFCFVDDTTNQVITTAIKLKIIQRGQSPINAISDKGCFTWESKEDTIKMIVKSPYHKIDTIVRNIKNKSSERIKLVTDDYALMIHYFSTKNVKDWKKHRDYLRNVISSDAIIYQIYDDQGIEIYNKEDFINKMTLITSSLKNINIIETQYNKGKIIKLKFKTN